VVRVVRERCAGCLEDGAPGVISGADRERAKMYPDCEAGGRLVFADLRHSHRYEGADRWQQ
jgi:hypothetical protein